MDNPETLATLGTQDKGGRQTKQKIQHKKIKSWAIRTPPNPVWNQVPAKANQYLLLIKHPLCYSYMQSSPVKVLVVIEERKNIRKK